MPHDSIVFVFHVILGIGWWLDSSSITLFFRLYNFDAYCKMKPMSIFNKIKTKVSGVASPKIIKIILLAKPIKGLLIVVMLLVALSAAIQQATPLLSKQIVDEIQKQVTNGTGSKDHLIFLISITLAVALFNVLINTFSNRLGDMFAGKLRKFLMERFYYKVLGLPQSYFDSEISGKMLNQLNRGVSAIEDFTNTLSNFILPTILQTVFTIVVLSIYSWQVAVFVTLLFPLYIWISQVSATKWGKIEVEKNKFEDVSRGRIQEVMGNIKLVKTFNNEPREWEFVSDTHSQIYKLANNQSNTFHLYDFIRNFGLSIILFGISLIIYLQTYSGEMSLGTMILIIQLVDLVRRPLFAMSFIVSQIQRAESGAVDFLEILNLNATESFNFDDVQKEVSANDRNFVTDGEMSNAISLAASEKFQTPTLEFKKVSFAYEETKDVLKSLSFKIEPREKIALVGESGAGKSTIVNLIMKLYEPTKGEITLEGKSYAELGFNQVRHNISYVMQDSEVFSTTIFENVAYGNDMKTIKEEKVIEALKLAHAYDFVMKFPDGLYSQVGERGVKLSGGQKQRLQIARAILKDAPILILDEATSSLDSKSEFEVQRALDNLMKDKLVIIIAHRFSTIQNVDRILVIQEGKIVDSGKPKTLAQKDGIYSQLLNYQVEGNKKLLAQFEIY